MSSFDVLAYVLRDATFAASNMTALPLVDRFAFLCDFLLIVLHLGLNDDVPKNTDPLNRISHFEVPFNEISNKFRRLLITHYSVLRGRMLVLAGIINCDIGVWESDLSTYLRDKYSGIMPPGTGNVVEMFPLLIWKGTTDVVNGWGVLLTTQPSSPAATPVLS